MGRAKLRMEPIVEETKRNTTYRHRKNGIIKKAKELSLLCDVDTAIIVYPPASKQPEIWPENPDQIKNMIGSYKQEKNENRKITYGLNDYFQDRKRKIEDELVRARERNVEAKYPTWFDDLNGLSEGQLRQFAMELENKKNAVKAHLERKKRESNVQIKNSQPSSSHSVGSLDHVEAFNQDDDLLMSQWLDDMLPDLFENNQPSVGSYPSLDQVQTLKPGLLMSQVNGRFNDMPDLHGFDLQQANYHYVGGSYTSLDQGGSMMSHDLGWFHDDAPTTWSIPERSGFSYPAFRCNVVYDNSNRYPRQTLEQCLPMPEGQLRQFAIGLENKKNTMKAHLKLKKRNLNVQIENNQPSTHSVGSLDQVEAFNHNDDLLMSQWFDDMPDLQMPFENNQPSKPSYPSLDQVEAFNHNDDLLMSQWFDDMPDLQMPFENNQPSKPSYPSLDQVEAFNHDDELLMSQWFDDMPDLQMPIEKNQPSNPSYPSLDQVQTLNPNLLMSQVIGRFNDMPDLQKQLRFELGNKQQANNSVASYTSPDQVGSDSMMSHDFGWFNDAPTTWSIPERSGFGYPVSGCDVVYDNSKPCPCRTLEQCSPMPEELALQDSHDGVGDGLNF
ncbi:hypothetical protein OSB04_030941 [Centaurea solstitialis]|uniref:MADS-box domain-containing protein n=1 Tax=Centaurea solstitialis TaxID=347529 RepID=A0AA38STS9_9ASTR|nr:hypothetical protein OSB04_030941 [Centaurea solstitialis]